MSWIKNIKNLFKKEATSSETKTERQALALPDKIPTKINRLLIADNDNTPPPSDPRWHRKFDDTNPDPATEKTKGSENLLDVGLSGNSHEI